jgi:hypothetical protein
MPVIKEKKSIILSSTQLVKTVHSDKELIGNIRRGVRACDAGKVRRWSEIKKELIGTLLNG